MNTIFYKIDIIVAQQEAKNTLLKPIMWRIYSYAVTMGISFAVLIYIFALYKTTVSFLLVLFPVLFSVLLFWLDTNRYAKKELKKQGIRVKNGFFNHWVSDEYIAYNQNCILKEMREAKIIPEDNVKSISLLNKYATYFIEKSKQNPITAIFKSTWGIASLFIIPYWYHFLSIFLHRESSIADIKFTLALLIIIIALISSIRKLFKIIFFSKHDKWISISEKLLSIKFELEKDVIEELEL